MFTGRVLKVAPDKAVTTIVDPNAIAPTGFAVHKDGRLFLAGVGNMTSGSIVSFQPDGRGRAEIIPPSAGYLPDDLVFDSAGRVLIRGPQGHIHPTQRGCLLRFP